MSAPNLHITMKFLGSVAEDAIAANIAAVEAGVAALGADFASPPRLQAAGLGAFPGPARPSVIFVNVHGVNGHGAAVAEAADDERRRLCRLAGSLDGWLEPLGFAREERPFHPHITIGRVRDRRARCDLSELIARYDGHPDGACGEPFAASELTLYESRQGSGGSEYTALARVPLVGGKQVE